VQNLKTTIILLLVGNNRGLFNLKTTYYLMNSNNEYFRIFYDVDARFQSKFNLNIDNL